MTTLAFRRTGTGAPLVLLHGIGSSHGIWDPVIPALSARFDVIAVDLPGFGASPPLPPGVEPAPAALARAVADLLDELDVETPNLVGNSLGGWVALELAALRPAASVTLLSPAGLWRDRTPLYCRASLRATRWLCEHAAGPLSRLVGTRLGRLLALSQLLGRPTRMTPAQARTAIRAMATCPGFADTLRAIDRARYRLSGRRLDVPVTVAFGSRDRLLLPRQSRHLDELPPQTRVMTLPGCGHLPMSDDPDAVAALVASSVPSAGPRRTVGKPHHPRGMSAPR